MKKTSTIILTAIVALTVLSLATSAFALPFLNWRNVQSRFGVGNGIIQRIAAQQNFARVDGLITDWGSTNVTGTIVSQSRRVVINETDVREGASATALWTTNATRPISALRDKENFTYTFYTARLINASVSSLNVTGYSYLVNGTWNVFEVTSTFTVTTDESGDVTGFHRSQDAQALASNAYGELKVASGANNFTLAIDGVDSLTGSVLGQRFQTKLFNPFKILNQDNANTVTKTDVSTLISAYGSSPGWGQYDQRMDYNFNYKVDICDLTTAAANVNL
ncbi:MAG: hypothetical protein NWF00_12930 [Candidatus Bathyarchaeota archaeon]|nr:hypothetical protein [Candidatus Bathyarchaeota archaeon]